MTYRQSFAFVALFALFSAGPVAAVELGADTGIVPVREAADSDHGQILDRLVQGTGTRDGQLSPRYDPVPPEPPRRYNSDYLFSMTRGVADSTMHAAIKGPLFLLSVPLDIVLLPATLIGGFFG